MQEPPLIAGVGGGVGTTTIATALRGRDCDIYQAHQPVHVLVCRSTMHSLGCAQRALKTVPVQPVLAIVDDVPGATLPSNVETRSRMTEGYVSAIVRVPFVTEWREVDRPYRLAAELLLEDDRDLSKGLRAYAAALRGLVDEIVGLVENQAEAAHAARGGTATNSAFAGR